MAEHEQDASQAVLEQVFGPAFFLRQMVFTAVSLGVVDALSAGPRDVEQLAAETKTHAPSLARFMRALAAPGFFLSGPGKTYELSPAARRLCLGAEGSLRDALLSMKDFYRAWGELSNCVRTGETGFEHAFGMDCWKYFEKNPDANERFNATMAFRSRGKTKAAIEAGVFPESGVLVDVGGGNGTLLLGVLERYPKLRGILFDLPHVVATATESFERAGIGDRCSVRGGNMFEGVPEGGDVYVLTGILHDWDDEHGATILQRCRQAMAPGSKLLILDRMMPEEASSLSATHVVDITMLVSTGGRERTMAEWKALFSAGGFTLDDAKPIGPVSAITGTPA